MCGPPHFACVYFNVVAAADGRVRTTRKEKKQQRNTRIYIYFVRYTYAIYEIANSSDSE